MHSRPQKRFQSFLGFSNPAAQAKEIDIDGYRRALLVKAPKIFLRDQEIKRLFAVNSLSISQSIS